MPYADKHSQKGCFCDRCEARRAQQRYARGSRQVRPSVITGEPVSDAERARNYRARLSTRTAGIELAGTTPRQPSTNVRTYGRSSSGIDYDAAIQAAAYYSVPPSGLPRASDRIVGMA